MLVGTAGMRVTILDGRQIVGRCRLFMMHLRKLLEMCQCCDPGNMQAVCCRFMAFDRHMNLVLGDSEEFRKLPPKKGKSDDEVSYYTVMLTSAAVSLSTC